MLRVYISGPYRSDSEWGLQQNIDYARDVARQVWKWGFAAFCPHMNSAHFGGKDIKDKTFLSGDILWLDCADAVIMLPHWDQSAGATKEFYSARKRNIPTILWSYGLQHARESLDMIDLELSLIHI